MGDSVLCGTAFGLFMIRPGKEPPAGSQTQSHSVQTEMSQIRLDRHILFQTVSECLHVLQLKSRVDDFSLT